MQKLQEDNASDTEKVYNLIKSIYKHVKENAKNSPYLIAIGEKAQQIAEEYKQKQLSTEEVLKRLESIV